MPELRFSSKDGRFTLALPPKCLRDIRHHATLAKATETGGILVGRYSNDLRIAHVTQAIGPPPDSRMGPTWFVRGVSGLQGLLNRFWASREYYLGEWHYHPGAPAPSSTDLVQLAKIATSDQYKCPEPLLCLVGPPLLVRCFVVRRGEAWAELHPDEPH